MRPSLSGGATRRVVSRQAVDKLDIKAAGLNHFVEFTNFEFTIFNKSDGSLVSRSLDSAFWTSAGVTVPSGSGLSDPRILFDPSSQRCQRPR